MRALDVIGHQTVKQAKRARASNQISSAILFATVALAPLPFGSTDPASTSLWCLALGTGLVFVSPRGLRRFHFALLGGIAIIILAYALVLREQLSSHTWLSVAQPNALWVKAGEVLKEHLEPFTSVVRNQPFFAIGPSLACMLSLTCSIVICSDRNRAYQLLKCMAWAGVGYAVFGIVQRVAAPDMVLWREKEAYVGDLTSTFINRNSAGVYFGSCAIVWLLLLCQRMRARMPRRVVWKRLPEQLSAGQWREYAWTIMMMFVCLLAMFMTRSRGGILFSLLGLVMGFVLFLRRDVSSRGALIGAVCCSAAVALVLFELLGAGVIERLDTQGLNDTARVEVYRSTIRMIAEHPWLGSGLGTFAWSFPAYRSASISMWGVFDRAHNTWLEIAAEMGLPFAAAIAVGWIVILVVLVHGVRTRRRDLALPVCGLSVAAVALLHSVVDFSLQIPGFAIPIFALVGAGLAQSISSNRRGDSMDRLPVGGVPEGMQHQNAGRVNDPSVD